MPIFEITSQKRMNTEYWTNVYHCLSPDLSAAAALAFLLVNGYEKSFHKNEVEMVSYRVRPAAPGAEGSVYPINVQGIAGPAGDYLPLFNVVRVDFATEVGRPSRKYYRMPLNEGEQTAGQLTAGSIAAFGASFDQMHADPDMATLCDVDGQLFATIRVSTAVGMRQLRRGSKRKRLPIIPVA